MGGEPVGGVRTGGEPGIGHQPATLLAHHSPACSGGRGDLAENHGNDHPTSDSRLSNLENSRLRPVCGVADMGNQYGVLRIDGL